MWEKSGTSGSGMGVESSAGVGVDASSEAAVGLGVGRGNDVTGKGEGVDAKRVKAGWQAEVSKEARATIHKRRVINFMSVSFSEFGNSMFRMQKFYFCILIIRVKYQVY
jgi:hypothetical protein